MNGHHQASNHLTTSKWRELQLWIVTAMVLGLMTLVLGEGLIRWLASERLIYNIEMVKYAKQLKIPDPLGQIDHVHRPSSTAHLMGVDVKLNSLGNRSDELPDPAVPRMLVLGSSVTMGWGVSQNQVFTSQLQEFLARSSTKGFAIQNAGIGNTNTFAHYTLFERQYPLVKPNYVLLHYFIRDSEPSAPANDSSILKYSYFADVLYDFFALTQLRAQGGSGALLMHYSDLYQDGNPAWLKTLESVRQLRDKLAQEKVPFLIMIVPDLRNISKDSPYSPIYGFIKNEFLKLGVPVVDSFPEFQKKFGDRPQRVWVDSEDPHPNALGHSLMAELLISYFTNNPLPFD